MKRLELELSEKQAAAETAKEVNARLKKAAVELEAKNAAKKKAMKTRLLAADSVLKSKIEIIESRYFFTSHHIIHAYL